jgi:hypothetical protein
MATNSRSGGGEMTADEMSACKMDQEKLELALQPA